MDVVPPPSSTRSTVRDGIPLRVESSTTPRPKCTHLPLKGSDPRVLSVSTRSVEGHPGVDRSQEVPQLDRG